MPSKKRHVSYAGNPMDYPDSREKIAEGIESMLKRHADGKIVLDESFVEEMKQKIIELRNRNPYQEYADKAKKRAEDWYHSLPEHQKPYLTVKDYPGV